MRATLLSTPTAHAPATALHDAGPRLTHGVQQGSVDLEDAPAGRYLAVDDGAERRLIPLAQDVLHVGRGLRAHVRLDDASVSRNHAILHQRSGRLRIVDDRSANGTWVNGQRVEQADLEDGDVIVIGRIVLTYVERAAA